MGSMRDRIEEQYHDEMHRENERGRIGTAIGAFCHQMKNRMFACVDRKSGWDNRHQSPDATLQKQLQAAVIDRDWVSVGNYAMMLDFRSKGQA
ncbi:hypothetical protein [Polycladidibacter hongkongensis]|uniref:hypothetical protein n=1 Tax=Polycladidibacter hongkongensis TaxID=1647556 RepID=UPI000836EFCA|nr:hypothetical protein [Pseudovibrio hongkongensis]